MCYIVHGVPKSRTRLSEMKDREAWRAAVHGVANSYIGLSDLTELNRCFSLIKATVLIFFFKVEI